MTGHGGLTWYTGQAPQAQAANISTPEAYHEFDCGYCDARVAAAVLVRVHEQGGPPVVWLRCTNCHRGSVYLPLERRQIPAAVPGESLEGLPPDVESAYDEARNAMGVQAHTAGELMCRKILMHVAVDKGAPEGDTFQAYVDYIVDQGYITPPMRPWADVIRQHGNQATHKIPASDSARGLGTLAFTTQLLRLVYEMDHKVAQYLPPPPAPDAAEANG